MTAGRVLLTGATGYIASHTWLALQAAGFEVVGVDNFVNSSPQVLPRLHRLGGRGVLALAAHRFTSSYFGTSPASMRAQARANSTWNGAVARYRGNTSG